MVLPLYDDNSDRVAVPVVNYLLIAVNVLVFIAPQQFGTDDHFTYAFATVPRKITTGQNVSIPDEVVQDPVTGERYRVPGSRHAGQRLPVADYVDVPARRLGASAGQHVVPVDLRRQRRGPARPRAVSLLLPAVRRAGIIGPCRGDRVLRPERHGSLPRRSGAISGVLGAYLLLYPTNRVMVLLLRILVAVPAFVAIGMWFVFQLVERPGRAGRGDEGRRRRLRGARRRLRRRHGAGPRLPDRPRPRRGPEAFTFRASRAKCKRCLFPCRNTV